MNLKSLKKKENNLVMQLIMTKEFAYLFPIYYHFILKMEILPLIIIIIELI